MPAFIYMETVSTTFGGSVVYVNYMAVNTKKRKETTEIWKFKHFHSCYGDCLQVPHIVIYESIYYMC